MNNLFFIVLGLLLFFLSLILVRLFCFYAVKRGLLDIPNARSSHQMATPRGGGIVFVLLWFAVLALSLGFGYISWKECLIFFPCTLCMSGLGLMDDHQSLPARRRLLVQILIASVTVALLGIGEVSSFHLFSNTTIYLGWIGIVVSVLGLVWSTNLFNFMDGLDGFAAIEALFVFGMGGWLYWFVDHFEIAVLIWSLGIMVAGFLVWNWPKARVFMGDVGSYFLGFSIALFALVGDSWYSIPIVFWVILYGAFWFDATMTVLRRLYNGDNLTVAHREHAFQRLHRAGFSQIQVLCSVLAVNSLLAIIVVWTRFKPEYLSLGLCTAFVILSISYAWVEKLKPMVGKIK